MAAAAAVVVAAVAAATEAAATASMAAKMEEVVLVMTTLRKLENQAHVVSKCRAEVRGRAFESLMAHKVVGIEEEVGGRKEPPAELPESVSSAGSQQHAHTQHTLLTGQRSSSSLIVSCTCHAGMRIWRQGSCQLSTRREGN